MIRILVDLRRNVLRLVLDGTPPAVPHRRTVPAVIDIGEAGALLGVELELGGQLTLALARSGSTADGAGAGDPAYLKLGETATPLARSARLAVEVVSDDSGRIHEMTIPRRGATYEISFPSGNRCWRPRSARDAAGQPVAWCSEVI